MAISRCFNIGSWFEILATAMFDLKNTLTEKYFFFATLQPHRHLALGGILSCLSTLGVIGNQVRGNILQKPTLLAIKIDRFSTHIAGDTI